MAKMRLVSWNVNGIRAAHRKEAFQWFYREKPDILCLQETKALIEQFPRELAVIDEYTVHAVSAVRKGYSGVATLSRLEPKSTTPGFGVTRFDDEGRTLISDFGDFTLLNVYFPNGKASPERLKYKLEFYDAFLDYVTTLRNDGIPVIICGDVNTAHMEIDLARPKENEKISGFLPEERAWIDRLVDAGFLDTFRLFTTTGGYYSWWDMKTRARERNVGWRIDYFFISEDLADRLISAEIHADIMGSDHCPVDIVLDI